eukprot:gene34856-45107_t
MYHSTTLLLPDARTLIMGTDQATYTPATSYEHRVEAFTPPWLLDGTPRPVITLAPTDVIYGTRFVVQFTGTVTGVSIMTPGSTSHGTEQSQRMVFPTFTQTAGQLSILAPPDATILLQGYHMLYLLNGDTPSEASWIRLGDLLQQTTVSPTIQPTAGPTTSPSSNPTTSPTLIPSTSSPTFAPSGVPTLSPSTLPSNEPSIVPSSSPTVEPSVAPTAIPTHEPSSYPSVGPSSYPTMDPTATPSSLPSIIPSLIPTSTPSLVPTSSPTATPSSSPSFIPSVTPTVVPTTAPSTLPTNAPTVKPSYEPTARLTGSPVVRPTARPVANNRPSTVPSSIAPSLSFLRPPISTVQTTAPTQTTAQLQFTQSLTLIVSSGCSGLNADLQSQTALEQTTAQSLQVPSSDVTYAGCTFGTATKAVQMDLLAESVSANMNVHIPLSRFTAVSPSNTSSVVSLFTKLQQKLATSVQSGDFTKQLTSTSKNLNANVTSKAVVSKTTTSGMAIQNPPTMVPTAMPPSSKSSTSNSNDNMYIIIGVVSEIQLSILRQKLQKREIIRGKNLSVEREN